MKLIKTAIVIGIIMSSFLSYGQRKGSYNGTELGLRVEGGYYNSFSLDATFPISATPRLHADLSFGDGWLGFAGMFDFLHPFPTVDGLLIYLGPGFGLGFNDYGMSASFLFELGIEYKFFDPVPLSIGFDLRPGIQLIPRLKPHGGAGLNVRYRFN